MSLRTLVIHFALALLVVFVLTNGCKDLGSDPPPIPGITQIVPSSASEGDEVRIDGQNFGGSRGASYVAFGTVAATGYNEWTSNEIKVLVPTGATTGIVKVVVGGRESNGVPFQVVAGTFGVPQNSVNLVAGDSLVQTISGGTPPYAVVSQSNPSAATASVSGALLTLRALSAGSSTVVIGDNDAPQRTDTVSVTVAAAVSFSSQIQPIFTANCVNAGCHPGGGAPFSLQSGQSYGNLVNVLATRGVCAGTLFRVKPFVPDSSALTRRLEGTTCGFQMPFGGSPLVSGDIALIRSWIGQGARQN